MSIEVRKKDRESSISLLRRFVRRVQQSGVLINARMEDFTTRDRLSARKNKAPCGGKN